MKNMKTISELAEVIGGYAIPSKERRDKGNFLILRYNNIQDDNLVFTGNDYFIDSIPTHRQKTILQPGDIIISLIPNEWEPFLYSKYDHPAVISSNFAIIRAKNYDYIQLYLSTQEGVDLLQDKICSNAKGTCIPKVNLLIYHK